jgi:hypothetical protein
MTEQIEQTTAQPRIKGGVITMGSLFWENGRNCLKLPNSVTLGKLRTSWRNENLVKSDAQGIQLPIRYGKKSSTRKYTYTMVFSRAYLNRQGSGQIIPFKHEIDFQTNGTLETQARNMAEAEGIDSNGNTYLAMDWCVMAIWIKPNTTFTQYLINEWHSIVNNQNNFFRFKRNSQTNAPSNTARNHTDFSGPNNDAVLLNPNFELIDVPINSDFDFLLLTYTNPRQNPPCPNYPDAETIANAINDRNSRYNAYLRRNIDSGIITCDDNAIREFLSPSLQF